MVFSKKKILNVFLLSIFYFLVTHLQCGRSSIQSFRDWYDKTLINLNLAIKKLLSVSLNLKKHLLW